MKNFFWFLLLATVSLSTFVGCKKDGDDDPKAKKKMLRIENGATSISPDQSVTFTAVLIDEDGNKTTATGVTWSSTNTGVATIGSNGQVSVVTGGVSTIRASVTVDGTTLTAEAPLMIQLPSIFVVAPWAILVDAGFPDIQLEPLYLGTGTTSFTYASSSNAVATVSSTGLVNFVGAGACEITVTATGLDGQPSVVVPVVVLAEPTIPLPVARVEITPSSHSLFKTETATFTAKAYNSAGEDVTANTTFVWSVDDAAIASVSQSGSVQGNAVGETVVRVEAEGIFAEAAIYVAPRKVLSISPYYATIAPGATRSFTAQLYDVSKSNGEFVLTAAASTPSNLQWEIPTYGISMFDIATVNQNGVVTMKSSATAGMQSFVLVSDPADPETEMGVAAIGVAMSSNCDCGTADPDAASLQLNSATTVTLSMGGTAQIDAQVLDAFGNSIDAAEITYCSSDIQVADVDFNGQITALAFLPGTATITVCHGGFSQTITVNVQ